MVGSSLASIGIPDEVVRLIVAALLGAAIGFERERGERAAGLRTHALVALASALVMLVSAFGFADAVTPDRTIVLDPSRIAAQVVSGVGFLGAGAIILRKDTVQGLTTAGSIWLVAGLGLACGAGMYVAAAVTTALALLILWGLKAVERRIMVHRRVTRMTLRVHRQPGQLDAIAAGVRASGLELQRLQVESGRKAEEQRVRMELRGGGAEAILALAEQLRAVAGVQTITYGTWVLASGTDTADEAADPQRRETAS